MSKAVSEFEKMNYLNEKPNVTNPMQSRAWPEGQIEGFIPVDGGRVFYSCFERQETRQETLRGSCNIFRSATYKVLELEFRREISTMKTSEDLNTIKNEVETVSMKLSTLTEEELEQVTGGNI